MMDTRDVVRTVVRRTGTGQPKMVGIAGNNSDNPVIVQSMSWWKMVGVRIVRMYLQTFFGLLGADAVAIDLGSLGSIGLLAIAPTMVSLGQNLLEILTQIDVTHPQLRG